MDTATASPEDYARYRELVRGVLPLYEREQYADALALVRAVAGDLPAHRSDTAHLAACLLALDGRPDEALSELRAAYPDGGWWARHLLEDDDDLAALAGVDGFADLVDAADRRYRDAPPARLDTVVIGSLETSRALLVVLHGANGDGPREAVTWQPFATDGVALLAPTSRHRTTPTHRTWLDATTRWDDVSEVALPTARLIVAGFSAGGRQAMQWATDPRDIVPDAFLVVCPAVAVDRLNQAALSAAAARGVRGHVLVGADDPGTQPAVAAVDLLRSAGIDVTLDVVDGLGHAYPDDFTDRTRPVLARLLG